MQPHSASMTASITTAGIAPYFFIRAMPYLIIIIDSFLCKLPLIFCAVRKRLVIATHPLAAPGTENLRGTHRKTIKSQEKIQAT
jgi:hypothetical protein